MPITSEAPSSVERSSRCNIPDATFGQNAHNFRDAIERGGEQRRENYRGFFWAYVHIRLSEGTASQQVLETSANAEFGHNMSMPEWAREPEELRSPGHSSQFSGVGRRIWPRGEMSDSGSYEA